MKTFVRLCKFVKRLYGDKEHSKFIRREAVYLALQFNNPENTENLKYENVTTSYPFGAVPTWM